MMVGIYQLMENHILDFPPLQKYSGKTSLPVPVKIWFKGIQENLAVSVLDLDYVH